MNTIADKLEYLEDTKTAIGNAIVGKGGSVTGKTFRQYATEISNLPSGGGGTKIAVSKDVSEYTGGTSFDIKKQITDVNWPSGITTISTSSFSQFDGLTSVTIPNSVTSIASFAFYGCHGLTSVTIGNNVATIGDNAFNTCTSLTSVTIPNSVTNIGQRVFYGCWNMTSVTIGSGVTSIGNNFIENTNVSSIIISDLTSWCNITRTDFNRTYDLYLNGSEITNLVIPNTLTAIKEYCFNRCTSLTSVTIPNSVTSIGSNSFTYCSNLTSITIPDSVTSIGSHTFGLCSNLTSITIPDSVTTIEVATFNGCSSLTTITIPSGVTSIGNLAFQNCIGLASITIEATTPPTLSNSNAFTNTNDCPIYVPAESVETYKAASQWANLSSRIQAIPDSN